MLPSGWFQYQPGPDLSNLLDAFKDAKTHLDQLLGRISTAVCVLHVPPASFLEAS